MVDDMSQAVASAISIAGGSLAPSLDGDEASAERLNGVVLSMSQSGESPVPGSRRDSASANPSLLGSPRSDQWLGGPRTRRDFIALGAGTAASLALAACGSSSSKTGTSTGTGLGLPSGGPVRRGGRLRLATVGGGTAETLNPNQAALSDIDIGRQLCLYDWLFTVPDLSGKTHLQLAESAEPNKTATEWTIRLRPGVEFHDGATLTADDLLYTLNWIANPKNAATNVFFASFWDIKNAKKLDNLTIRLPLTLPIADLPAMLGVTGFGVIRNGTTSFAQPNGTGPWKFVSWTPGQHSLFVRNPNYYESGLPYLDELELLSIPDETARLNAVLGGQVDGSGQMPYAQAKSYVAQGSSAPFNILVNNGISEVYFTMGTAAQPFSDRRVRQAMRLVIDRQAMINTVQSGFGRVLNDLWGKGFPYYNNNLLQRQPDIEQAKWLLKRAGYENLSVTLSTAETVAGQVEAATLLQQQAAAAGVTIALRKVPASTYYSTGWPNYPFGQTEYEATTIPYFYAAGMLPGAPFNDTQWKDPATLALAREAIGDPNPATAQDKWNKFQEDLWTYGAQIHWGTSPYMDFVSKRVHAAPATSAYYDWGGYDLKRYWLA